jgi:pyruvate ferredoxin oxidoreductase beta subunit
MNTLPVYSPLLIDKKEYLTSGHRACQGCAEALAVRMVMKALGRDTIVAMATGCMEIISSPLPTTAWTVPWIHVAFENAPAVISGCEAGVKAMMRKGKLPQKKINFVSMGGDGATADIGMGQLSGALERGHDCIYICYDNEAYMNTGIQRSSSTPWGASTTTSPSGAKSIGQTTNKKNMAKIAMAHEVPYVATACSSYPLDLIEKVKRASETPGAAYIHVLSVCPTGWRIEPDQAIRYGRLAVESCVFPLYESINGKIRMTWTPEKLPVTEYLKGQGRFRHLKAEEIALIQQKVDEDYNALLKQAEEGDANECR